MKASHNIWGAVFLTAGLLCSGYAVHAAGDWPCWRGANHDGISTEKGWKVWGSGGPKKLWDKQVGTGYAAVSVADGRVYTMGNADGQDTVYCFEAATGKVIWKHSYACPSPKSYPGTRSTPTVDGGHVYTLSRKGHVFALDAKKGTKVWEKNVARDPGAKTPKWDFSGSPLVVDNLLILNVGEQGLALDKNSGRVAWKSGPKPAGYAAPVPFNHGGKRSILIFAAKGLAAVDVKNGRRQWFYPWETSYDVNAADPIVSGDNIFISSDYGKGGALLKVAGNKAKVVWQKKVMKNHANACVLYKGHLYGDDGTINKGDLKCVDLNTGNVKWSKKKLTGSLMIADGKMIFLSVKGDLLIIQASPNSYKELARAKVIDGRCWSVPVLADGRIYCRNEKGHLVCLSVK